MISKNYSNQVLLKDFFDYSKNPKNIFVLGVSKVPTHGVDKIFRKKKSQGYPQPKVGKSQEISGMGCKKIF